MEENNEDMCKKGWIDLNCDVCKKSFKKPIQILYPTGHPDLAVTETQFCSKNCEKISERTFNNPIPTCFDCKEHIDLSRYNGSNGWLGDYKDEKSYPLCDDCDKKFAEYIMMEIEKNR